MSERRGCAALRFDRSTHRYRPIRDEEAALRKRMREIASVRVRYGYRRIHVLLRREGWAVNHKRVQRLYREEGLNLRVKRPRRHVTAARRVERAGAAHANDIWSMDFVSDALFNGRRFRALTIVDAFTRECLAIEVDQGLKADAVVATIERLTYLRGTPRRRSGWITVRNLSQRSWTTGPTCTGWCWTSPDRASRRTTPLWKVSTAGCATNA